MTTQTATPKKPPRHPWRMYGSVPTPEQREADRLRNERVVRWQDRMGVRR